MFLNVYLYFSYCCENKFCLFIGLWQIKDMWSRIVLVELRLELIFRGFVVIGEILNDCEVSY